MMKLTPSFTTDELLRACKAGDRKAQELLYRQMASKMLAVCMRYARERMEAEDCMQLGFIKVFQKISDFNGSGSFEGWIRKVMVNTAIESYRKNLRTLNIVSIDECYDQPATNTDFGKLELNELLRLIQRLADGYRIVFNMYVIEGYSHREIAESLGISEGASKSQLSRARALLREEINKMEGIDYAKYTG